MNGVVRERNWLERNWLGSPLVSSYTKSKTMELVLSATFSVTYHIARQFKFMVFPTVFIRICGIFAYIPAMFLPWKYTWVIPAIVLFTSPNPIASTLALTAGIQVSYFASRILKRYRILALVLATFSANLTMYGVLALMGIIPAEITFPFYMFKAAVTTVSIVALAPIIIKILEHKKIVDFRGC